MSNEPNQELSISSEVRENLDRNNITLDIDDLYAAYPAARDIPDSELLIAYCVFKLKDVEKAGKLLHLKENKISGVCRKSSIQGFLRFLIASKVGTIGVMDAYDVLSDVMDDITASPSARVKAAETVLKWSGEMDKDRDAHEAKSLSDMSADELEDKIQELENKKAEKTGELIEQ